ncbi:hypothetical protein ACHQM5_014550 [Ranunculus cassubicifolius]
MAKPTDPIEYARRGDVEYFKEVALNILEKSRNEKGDSVLSEAAMENHLECCKVICRRSPSLIYHKNVFSFTALHSAAMKGNTEIVEFLIYARSPDDIESGRADNTPNTKLLLMVINNGGTALHMAVNYRNTDTVRSLIQADITGELLQIVDDKKMTALHFAVEFQSFDMVKLFVDPERDIEYHADGTGLTPLLAAMRIAQLRGDPNSVNIRKLLIQKQKSQIKLRVGDAGWTALHYATSKGDLSAIEDIIQCDPQCLEIVDNDGRNFLHLAAMSGYVKVVEHILGTKEITETILNAQDNFEETPLHIAAKKGNASTALCLLYDARVDKMIKDAKGQSAVELITFEYDREKAGVFGVREAVNEKKLKEQSDFDLVVDALIATLSFTAGITVPGGYISEGPNQGMAVLSKKTSFEIFIIANTFALLLSLSAVFSHFCTRLLHKRKDINFQVTLATVCTLGAIFAMVIAFITGSYAVLAIREGLAITVSVLSGSFFVIALYSISRVAMQNLKRTSNASNSHRQNRSR